MNRFIVVLLPVCMAVVGCGGPGEGELVKVERFSAPLSVRVKALPRALEVSWKPSPDAGQSSFAGYNVYYAKESLLLAGSKDLPEPITAGKDTDHVVIRGLEPGVPYFIHVRARRKSGELSLPSLPEVVGVPGR